MSCFAGGTPASASFAVLLFFAASSAVAQQVPVPASVAVPATGLESPYEARSIVNTSLTEVDTLTPLLASLRPDVWYQQRGAPSTYVVQVRTAQQEVTYVDTVGKQFLQKIESLSLALDLYYRMEALEATVRSVNEGAQRYGDPAIGSKLAAFVGKSFDRRQRFRDYVGNLATNLEQNYQVADEEAQRCRAIISKEPTAGSKGKKSK